MVCPVNNSITISIIVPVYEQWELCSSVIQTIISQMAIVEIAELIVVDNDSVWIPDFAYQDEFIFLKCEKPGSYAARNLGLSQARGELILFTDADCVPSGSWIQDILKAYERSDKKTLLAGNVTVRSDNKTVSTAELYDIDAGLPQERYVSKGYAVTANLAVPRVVFNEVGLFDEERFSGGDADFCQRALLAGFSLKFVPEAVVFHPARNTWNEYAIKVRRTKGGQIRAGSFGRRLKYSLITLLPPIWRIWRTVKSNKLKPFEKVRVAWFQVRLWLVELIEMVALLLGKRPERR